MSLAHVLQHMGQEGVLAMGAEGYSAKNPPHPSRVADQLEEIIKLFDHADLSDKGREARDKLERLRMALDAYCFDSLPDV